MCKKGFDPTMVLAFEKRRQWIFLDALPNGMVGWAMSRRIDASSMAGIIAGEEFRKGES
jgi:hypothetical protein